MSEKVKKLPVPNNNLGQLDWLKVIKGSCRDTYLPADSLLKNIKLPRNVVTCCNIKFQNSKYSNGLLIFDESIVESL